MEEDELPDIALPFSHDCEVRLLDKKNKNTYNIVKDILRKNIFTM